MNTTASLHLKASGSAGGATLRSVVQRGLLLPGLGAVCDLRVSGAEHLAGTAPAVIVANHESLLDFLIVMRAMPAERRRVTAVTAAADFFFRSSAQGKLVRACVNAVPMERCGGGRGAEALEICASHLTRGGSVIIFPEGTRSTDGEMARCRRGAARIALAAGAPVIPLGTYGARELLPKGKRLPQPGAVWVHAGAPIVSRGHDAESLTTAVDASIRVLRGDARRTGGAEA